MSEGNSGVSAGYVNDAIQRAFTELQRYVEQEISRLEQEMQNLAQKVVGAINHQTDQLSRDLDKQTIAIVAQAGLTYKLLSATRDELTHTRERLVREFSETRGTLALKTEADLQIELSSTVARLSATRSKINTFVADIEARFEKAVEGVYLNRQLYNLNFKKILEDYANKIRTIAQHIYEITEQDFGPATRAAMTPPSQICDLPIEVDLLRLRLREESLDRCLEILKGARLDEILLSLNKLRLTLENEFRLTPSLGSPADAPRAVHGLFVGAGADETILVQATVSKSHPGADERIVLQPPADGLKRYHEETARRLVSTSVSRRAARPATEIELGSLRAAAARLLQAGTISPDNKGLFEEFLDRRLLVYVE